MNDEERLKGITISGNIPLCNYLEKLTNIKIGKEVCKMVDEAKGKGNLYHPPQRLKYQDHREENGPVTQVSKEEIHAKNRDNYFKQALRSSDPKQMVAAILLTEDKPLTYMELAVRLNQEAERLVKVGKPMKVNNYSIRTYIGKVCKSQLGDYIEVERKRGLRARYYLHGKEYLTFDQACKLTKVRQKAESIREQVETDTRIEQEEKKTPPGGDKIKHETPISFTIKDVDSVPVLRVEGNFNFHFYLHIGSK
jgi:hypothetical protein